MESMISVTNFRRKAGKVEMHYSRAKVPSVSRKS